MGLPQIFAQPQNDADWQSWAFQHAANHYDIVAAINQQFNAVTVMETNALSPAGFMVIQFDAIPDALQTQLKGVQLAVIDTTSGALAVDTTVTSYSSTEIGLSQAVVAPGVGIGDSIQFAPFTPVNLQQFPLTPMDFNNLGNWDYQHQIMHAQANAILGFGGFDLLSLDWEDPNELAVWFQMNGNEHQRLSAALGIA